MKITGAPSDALLKAASIQRARAAGISPRPAVESLDARAARVQDVPSFASLSPVAPASATRASSPLTPDAAARIDRIVSAVVPGRVDFDDARVTSAASLTVGGALALYTRPGDKNAAATAVTVGRSLDITG